LGDTQGKQFTKLVTELEQHHQSRRQESGRKLEQLAQIRAYIDYWLENLGLNINRKQLLQYFFNESSEGIELEAKQRKVLSTPHKLSLSQEIVRYCNRFSQAFDNVFKHSLRDVIVQDKQLKETLEPPKKINNSTTASPKDTRMEGMDDQPPEPTSDRLDTYAGMGCTICGTIWCQTHGDYTQQTVKNDVGNDSDTTDSDQEEVSYEFRPVIIRYDDLLRKQDVRLAEKPPDMELPDTADAPCSDDCYRIVDSSNLPYELSPDDISKIRGMVISLREKRKRPCDISFLLNLPCWQVESELNMLEPRTVEIKSPGRPKRLDWYDNKRKVLKDNWGESSRAHLHHELAQANPVSLLSPD
jgi:hypothetical protein